MPKDIESKAVGIFAVILVGCLTAVVVALTVVAVRMILGVN